MDITMAIVVFVIDNGDFGEFLIFCEDGFNFRKKKCRKLNIVFN